MKRKVNVGSEIEGQVRLIEHSGKLIDTKVRAFLTIAAVALGSGFVLGAAIMGFGGDAGFIKLQAVWSVVGPIFGAIGGYYYKSSLAK